MFGAKNKRISELENSVAMLISDRESDKQNQKWAVLDKSTVKRAENEFKNSIWDKVCRVERELFPSPFERTSGTSRVDKLIREIDNRFHIASGNDSDLKDRIEAILKHLKVEFIPKHTDKTVTDVPDTLVKVKVLKG